MNKPLHGLKVIELGQLLAGPLQVVCLAIWCREVIKIEPPGGDPIRNWRELKDVPSMVAQSCAIKRISFGLKVGAGKGVGQAVDDRC